MAPHQGSVQETRRSTDLADLEPCMFPAFDAGETNLSEILCHEGTLDKIVDHDAVQIHSILCAAWGILLQCFTGLDNVSFGFDHQGIPNMSKSIPSERHFIAHMKLPNDKTVASLLDEIVTGKHLLSPSPAGNDCINTGLSFGTIPSAGNPEFTGARSSLVQSERSFNSTYTIHMTVDPESFKTIFSWAGSFMTQEQAKNVASTYERIVDQITAHPKTLISKIDSFSESHLRQVLIWNSKPKNHMQRCIHEVISDNALSRPEAEAVCAWDGSFSYLELMTLSDQLAHRLTASGVGPEVFVPICFDKSRFTIVAMLAILKAGGIFVPLDPTHPIPRLQALAQKVEAATVLCSRQHLSMLETVANERIAVDHQLFAELSDVEQDIKHASWDNGAYMIFTSGTTGEPKGALIQHGALLSSALAHGPAMLMDSNTRSLQFAASTFDVSITEILTCLILGGCVCVPSEEARLNSIEDAIVQLRVNWALLTPTFVKFIDPVKVPCLKTLVTGGEAMTQAIIRSWSHINLINCYGPAETSVVSHVHRGMTEKKSPLNIGYQVGVHCWIVDRFDHNRLVPIGVVGELVIEGHTLAREYYKEPQKTNQAFICDPAWTRTQPSVDHVRRMYRTGDLVKYNHDGSFHITGRADTQIKYHGQRIELGEIEHHLNVIPTIKHGIVALPKDGLCRGSLLTVIQLSDSLGNDLVPRGQDYKLITGELETTAKDKIAEAKSILQQQLPPYMIPSLWIAVEFIPRLQSGKLDRKQTSQWVQTMSEPLFRQLNPATGTGQAEDMTQASKTEREIHNVWTHVLNLEEYQLGLRQSFLSVGGDSITAMQVMSECKKRGLGLTVRHIMGCKSITALALHVKVIEQPLFHKEILEEPFDLSPIQQLYFSRPNHSQGHYNQSFLLRTSRHILAPDLSIALQKIIRRHSMLRARFRKNDKGEWKQRVTNEVVSSYRLRTLTVASSDDVDASLVDSQKCLSETNGPLFAADIIGVGNSKEQLLFLVAHHLVIDLVSWRVILQELEELLLRPDMASLKDQPLPFQVWCKMQAEHAQNSVPASVMPIQGIPDGNAEYWGMGHQPNIYGQMIHEGFEIDSTLTSQLLSECHKAFRTEVPDILLAALLFSFGQTFPDRSVPAVFAEGHGREPWDSSIDLSNVIGWFTTIYPVFAGASPQSSFVNTVKLVKDNKRKIPDLGRPYFASRWLTEQGKQAFERHWPLEITFNYLGQYQQLEREGALFTPAKSIAGETRGATQGADVAHFTTCISLFEISAVILKGQLRFSFAFNQNMHHQSEIRQWISLCQDILKVNIEKLSTIAPEPTLSDFPLLALTYGNLQLMVDKKLPQAGVPSIDLVEDVYPCSPMQSGLLVSTAKNDAFYAAYTLHEVKSRKGRVVDPGRLAQAWKRMVAYHPMLRTIFIESVTEQDCLYDQVVLRYIAVPLHQLDRETDEAAINTLDSSPKHQADMSRPLHHFQICTSKTGRVFCRLDISHVIMDGTSLSILFRDLALAYESGSGLSEGPKYRDYIGYLAGQDAAHSIGYWRSYLSGFQPCYFPILDDGNVVKTKEWRYVRIHFDKLKELQLLCEKRGVTIVNAIYTAWAMVLSLYTGSEDVCFGYLSSARDAAVEGVRDVVGPVIDMVVRRAIISKSTSLGAVMSTMQKDYLDSLPHRHLSLASLQHALKLSDTALFNTAVSYRKLPPPEQHPADIVFENCRPTYDPDEYNVSVNIEAGEEEMAIDLTYWTDTLSDGQAANIADAFNKALSNILHHCDEMIADLHHLGDACRRQLSVWNQQMPAAIEATLHDLIAHRASSHPQALALASSDMNLTFAELDHLSSKLALHLATLGVGLETFVLLCFEKSAMAIVSMVAVLKAGGVCVPLDPTHPDSALTYRAQDTGASLALASPSLVSRLSDLGPYTLAVDTGLLQSLPEVNGSLLPDVRASNACFVIYTSGSTGKPKGVVLEHRGIATNAEYSSSLGYKADSRVLQFASYTFDNSLAEIFTTLIQGGCVCVPSDQERLNDLAGVINRLQVTMVDITPTVACFLQPSDVPTLQTIALGGEAVTVKCVDMWRDHVALTCCYGPSECSVNATFSEAIATPGQATNIGHAISCVAWVVDPTDHNCLLPMGCAGELLIDGPNVSRGYLNMPEKTAESFIQPPPWLKDMSGHIDPSRRLYKTADLVRYNTDGTLTYLGRKDNQVKLNGQRIELGEIEHHLEQALPEGIQSAVELVVANGVKSLACFICTGTDTSVPAADADSSILAMSSGFSARSKQLEVVLTGKVPSYMVPTLWLPMSQMPLTSSGKLNRRDLRMQVQARSSTDIISYRLASRSGRAPSSDKETQLAAMWATVLDIEVGSIGVEDNFFKLGGDSIGAMRLVRLARKSNVSLTVGSIFQTASLQEMAMATSSLFETDTSYPTPFALMTKASSLEKLKEEVALQCGISKHAIVDIYPCTAIQEGLMALTAKDPGAYVARLVYRLAESTDLRKFKSAWDHVVKMESILRTRIVHLEDSGFVQVVTNDTIAWNHVTGISDLQETDRRLPPHDGGGLSNYSIVEEASGISYFVWTIHHALYDGWCMPIILDKVKASYQTLSTPGEGSSPPYSRFMKYLSGLDPRTAAEYWQRTLSGTSSQPFPRLPNPGYQASAKSLKIHKTVFCRTLHTGLTAATRIRAAWALTLSAYTTSSDVLFLETVTGRDAPVAGIEDMVGPTLATIPRKMVIDDRVSVAGFLANLQKEASAAFAHSHIGIQHIQRLSGEITATCSAAQNLIAINNGARIAADSFWDEKNDEMAGTNFYTYPLMLSCHIGDDELETVIHFDKTVLPEKYLDRVMSHFAYMLDTVSSTDMQHEQLGNLDLLSPADHEQLQRWNSKCPAFTERRIHDMIRECANIQKHDKPAVCAWDFTFTYGELNSLSDKVASLLMDRGVDANSIVPFCLDKSAYVVVSMLGILKTGAAFVPLDPAHPDTRLSGILADVEAKLILSSPSYVDRFKKCGYKSLSLSQSLFDTEIARKFEISSTSPACPAYVIFTSGTTGKPKGTIVSHSAFCTGALAHGQAMGMTEMSRVLQFASHTFDASIMEILTTLIFGGTVCIPSNEDRINDLAGAINNFDVNWTLLTPSVAQTIHPSLVPGLKTLVLGGEAMSAAHIAMWASAGAQLMNAYGPSETAVVATVNSNVSAACDPADIGYAVGGICWVTDANEHNRLVPIGAVGELVVEGPILAQGYLNNRTKTDELFITNPRWCSAMGGRTVNCQRRMYKTGDLVKLAEDGSIIFQGRKDNQVKINGQRLELSEVEHHLSTDPAVQYGIAAVPSSGPCKGRLVAILTLSSLAEVNQRDNSGGIHVLGKYTSSLHLNGIRQRVAAHLASYMVPSKWIVVNRLPLLSSGKLDRRQAISWVEAMTQELYQQVLEIEESSSALDRDPTEVETQLRAAWAKVLDCSADKVPFNQSFLHLGGDSISAMQLISACRSVNISVTVTQVMQCKSVIDLAGQAIPVQNVVYHDELENQAFPLSPIQRVYFECLHSSSTHFNQSVMLNITRSVSVQELSVALEKIIETHSMLRARFTKESDGWSQYISSDVAGSYKLEAHSNVASHSLSTLIGSSQQSLDIYKGPLIAADIFEMREGHSVSISLAAHHLVVDIVSWNIIIQDLEKLLSNASEILPRSLSFQTWNEQQLERANISGPDTVFEKFAVPSSDFSYWGMENVANLHSDISTISFDVDAHHSLLLLDPSQNALQTDVVDILLASLLESFRQTFPDRSSGPAIFNEGHGRESWDTKTDLSRTVGWFTTLCPVYLPSVLYEDRGLLDTVAWVKDFRRRVPEKGRSHFAHSVLQKNQHQDSRQWPVEITFNYLGQTKHANRADSVFKVVDGSMMDSVNSQTDIGLTVPRLALIEISSSIQGGILSFEFSYNHHMSRQDCIRKWARSCESVLKEAVQALSEATPEPTMDAFPLLPLEYKGVSRMQQKLFQAGVASLDDIETAYPCSPVQQGILFTQMKQPDCYNYHIAFEILPTQSFESVELSRLTQAWQAVVDRHSALRTVFLQDLLEEGTMSQVVLKTHPADIACFECTDDDLERLLGDEGSLGLPQSQPPHRLRLCQTPDARVLCRLEMSHAISDGTSMPILFRDLALAYQGSIPSGKLDVYGPYLAYLESSTDDSAISYWKAYLDGVEPCLFPVTTRATQPRALHAFDQVLTSAAELQGFCAEREMTLSSVLQFAWAIVLQAYTGLDEVSFGYLVSGRDIPVQNIDEAIGVFINMLVCKVRIDQFSSIEETLQGFKTNIAQGMGHKQLSLADLLHKMNTSGTPLFNSAYSFQRRSMSKNMVTGPLSFDIHDAHDPSEYDITVNVEVWDSSAQLQLCYWTDKISDSMAKNVASTYDQVLTSLVNCDIKGPLRELELLSAHCSKQVQIWNEVEPIFLEECVHHVVERSTKEQPLTKMAIQAWDGTFTYKQLNDAASRLAHHLVTLGVKRETYVPLCFEKSAWNVVAMLAVLKVGAAFVPLHQDYPTERISFLLQSVDAKLVLCSPMLAQKLIQLGIHIFALDSDSISGLPHLVSSSSAACKPNSPAYIIFTSGTTGLPKGIIVEHGAFTTGGTAHAHAMKMTSSSRVLQFASHTFDASIMEILSTLLVGGCICIPSDVERLNELGATIQKYDISWALLTPSVANVLKPGSVPNLKVLVTGGEAMSRDHITKWAQHASLINAYGPSETSVVAATSTKVDENGTVHDDDPSTIGYAVGSRCWVVDPRNHDRLMPVGSIGELLVEGPIVARGYLKNESKTQDAFIDHPPWRRNMQLAGLRKDRIYKTGDLVAYNADGSLSYKTRKDTQVKLNGQRLELGEIEHHVKAHLPSTSQSAVELVVPSSRTSAKALAVFFTSDIPMESNFVVDVDNLLLPMSNAISGLSQSLRTALTSNLPSYMVPTIYVPITKMPWTSAGKLDRSRLKGIVGRIPSSQIGAYKLAHAAQKRKPTTRMQRKLHRVWQKVLKLDGNAISRDDSFFRLGGDSIGAMKLVAAARLEDIVLTVLTVFQHPKLSEMAEFCQWAIDSDAFVVKRFSLLRNVPSLSLLLEELAERCQVLTTEIQDAYPCSSLQEGLTTLSLRQHGAYVAENVFELHESVDIERFKEAWQRTVDETDILRSRLVNTQSLESYQVVLEPQDIAWEYVVSTEPAEHCKASLPERPGGTLAQYKIVTRPDTKHRYFVWTLHHALYDGWSMHSLMQTVSQYYHHGDNVHHVAPVPFANFIKYLADADKNKSDRFWKSKFADASPTHFPPVLVASTEVESKPSTLTHKLDYSRSALNGEFTMPTVIRATWALVLASQTNSVDVVYGETLSGRDIPLEGIEEILGPTLATIPVRVRVDQDFTVGQLLQNLHVGAAEVIPYQHAGLQHMKTLDDGIAVACNFNNLLVIQFSAADDEREHFMTLKDDHKSSDSFFTYPLVLECAVESDNLVLTFHHDENVISSWHVQRIAHQFDALLRQVIVMSQDPKAKIADLERCSPQDTETIKEWNNFEFQVVNDSIADLFLSVATKQPDNIAIHAWDGRLSYGQVHHYACLLAKLLLHSGLQSESLIPCCMEKSLYTPVVLMAVVLAGGTVVPLDPAHPPARHAEIIRDCRATLALCSTQHQARFANFAGKTIAIDADFFNNFAPGPEIALQVLPKVSGQDAAIVIYTSGSTGTPKGVVIEHNAFNSSFKAFSTRMNISASSRIFHFSSYAFDIAMAETLGAFTIGACVCVPSELMRTGGDLPGAMNTLGATWAFLTPSVASIQDPSKFKTLKTLVCGGEALSPDTIDTWAESVELMNGYGPAECVVFSVANANVSTQRDHTCIGKAMSGGHTWVVDPRDHNRLAPLGCVGELLMEGPILARGYLNDAKKTATSFIENPDWAQAFASGSESRKLRLYKTGDLVKYCPDGTLTFIGRQGTQVKLRGQRLDLGEIEANLETDARVFHSLVGLPNSGFCKGRVTAILSLHGLASQQPLLGSSKLLPASTSDKPTSAEIVTSIQESLAECLPSYMVPSIWLVVQTIPLLVSGKLDRKSVQDWLSKIDKDTYQLFVSQDATEHFVQPVTTVERLIRGVWSSVLKIDEESVPANQSFISLGGDSILAMQAMTRFRDHSINLPMQAIIKCKSIADLAKNVRLESQAITVSAPAYEEKVNESFALSPIQQLFFNNSADKAHGDRFNQSMLLSVQHQFSEQQYKLAVKTLVERHSVLCSRFTKNDQDRWTQLLVSDVESSYDFRYHQINVDADMTSFIAHSQDSIRISGPMLIVDVFEKPDGTQLLSLIAHHLVVDMVSWLIIVQDLANYLENISSVKAIKAMSFQEWSLAQARNAKSREDEPDSSLPFDLAPSDLGFWGMRDARNTYGDAIHKSFICTDPETVRTALGHSHEALGSEPLDLFISALLQSFRLTFRERGLPTLFNEGHGREPWDESIDLSETVGWFTALCPVQISQETAPDPIDIVRRVKDVRRSILSNGRDYFAHRYLTKRGRQNYSGHESMEIMVNYLGRTQQKNSYTSLLEPYDYPKTEEDALQVSDVSPDAQRLALFEISISVVDQGVKFSFMYNKHMLHQERISEWVSTSQLMLIHMTRRLSETGKTPTLSDLSLMPMNYSELDKLQHKVLPAIGVHDYTEVEDIYPCSPVQTGILLSQLQNPGRYLFHTVVEVQSPGFAAIDPTKLSEACALVVDRHAALRTVFTNSVYRGGTFDQIVLKPRNYRIKTIRCREIEVMAKLDAHSLEETNKGPGPSLPYQITICYTPKGKVIVKLELNHAITDGASTALIMHDISKAYADDLSSTASPHSYRDYIQYLSAQSLDSALSFWTSYLLGGCATYFPTISDDDSAACPTLSSIAVDFPDFSQLQSLSSDSGVTLANILLCAWALILRRYTKSDDVCFGYLASGRDAPIDGIHEIVGPFLNMLIFRFRFVPGMLLGSLFKNAQEDYLASLPHQHVSLARVTNALGYRGKRGLFNTAVSLQNAGPTDSSDTNALTFESLEAYDPSEYAVTLNVNTARGDEGILIRFWSDVLSATQAQELASTMSELLDDFVHHGKDSLSQLQIFQGSESPIGRVSSRASTARSSASTVYDEDGMEMSVDFGRSSFTGDKFPDIGPQKGSRAYAKARGLLASKLTTLWRETLKLADEPISQEDSFFELGGDSIIAISMVGNARDLDLALTVADIFKNATFGDMLEALLKQQLEIYEPFSSVGKEAAFLSKKQIALAKEDQIYEPFSLLNLPDHEQFIRSQICPAIGKSRASILDVLPTTNFQTQAIAGQMLPSRWMLNHFYLDGSGSLDISLLRESVANVVSSFDILRTVFAQIDGQCLQIVLRQLTPDVIVEDVDSINAFTALLESEHRLEAPQPGDSLVRFIVVRQNSSNRHRIFIRISHAQYDGVCFSAILAALKACYDGEPIYPTPSYSNYVHGALRRKSAKQYGYWQRLLEGSSMTDIVPRSRQPAFQTFPTRILKQTLYMPSLAAVNITTATIVKAAWALVLAEFAATSDVVFGHLISGRNVDGVSGIENIVGPCLNLVPVRVRIDHTWTALQLLNHIQQQQVENMPYESLGFQEVIDKCTKWNATGKRHGFSTVVQHQSMPQTGSLEIGGNNYTVGALASHEDTADFSLVTTPVDASSIEVSLIYAQDGEVGDVLPKQIMEAVCQTIGSIAKDPLETIG